MPRQPNRRKPVAHSRKGFADAVAHLSARQSEFARVIAAVGPCTLRTERDLFAALVGTVISQQISVRAADTIEARLKQAVADSGLTPAAVLALTPEALRACGLSAAKQRSIRAIA